MKKLISLLLAMAVLLCMCACGANEQPGETTEAQVKLEATEAEKAHLESLYQGRTVAYGDTHAHSASTEYSDGRNTLKEWKAHMAKTQIDFAVIQDHRQTLHMSHEDWDETVFIGGSEPSLYVIGTEYVSKNGIDYAMIFTDLESFENYLNTFMVEYQYNGSGRFKENFTADHAKLARMIQAIKDNGGMFTYVHPMGDDAYYNPVDPMDRWFADETGFEVCNQIWGTFDSEYNAKAYEQWVFLINNGKRIWATSASDAHGALPEPYVLSTVYAAERNDEGYFAQLSTGNLTAGPVGIRTVVGDAVTGSVGSFAGKRVVMAVGDFHPQAVNPTHTYRLDIYDETGLIASQELNTAEMNYFAFDARSDALYYRANVYDVTESATVAVGNPVFNEG